MSVLKAKREEWRNDVNLLINKLNEMNIEDEKKLIKIKNIMKDCTEGKTKSIFTLLYNMNGGGETWSELFTDKNSVSDEQYEDMLLVLTEKQLELIGEIYRTRKRIVKTNIFLIYLLSIVIIIIYIFPL